MSRPVGTSQISAAPRLIREITDRGLEYKAVADRLDVPVRNLRFWSRGHPEIKNALDEIGAVDSYTGRSPTPFKPEYCEIAIRLGKEGGSLTEIAAEIGVGKSILNRWIEQEEAFEDAMELARTYSQSWWEKRGRDGLTEIGFNGNLWSKNMPSRFRDDWSERNTTTIEAGDGISNLLEQLNGRSRGLPTKDK